MKLLRYLYTVTIFLSAFLLFVVEPMAAKQLLPALGGSAAVWTTCLVFFSVVLLLGYLYAHWLSSQFTPAQQAVIHVLLLTAALMVLGIHNRPNPVAVTYHPALTVFRVLAMVIGLPYLALSATTPLLTGWYASSFEGRSPYRLFALSNLASLLALGSYPLLIEPRLTMNRQTAWWSGGFFLFAVICGAIAWQGRRRVPSREALRSGWAQIVGSGRPRSPVVCAGPGRRHDADSRDQPHEREHRCHSPAVAAAVWRCICCRSSWPFRERGSPYASRCSGWCWWWWPPWLTCCGIFAPNFRSP